MSHTIPVDPFKVKSLSKLHPYRLVWTSYNRALNRFGRLIQKPLTQEIKALKPEFCSSDRGKSINNTAVTSQQMTLLKLAVENILHLNKSLAEIGSYRGITTKYLASLTPETVYAIDPYAGYGGWENDLAIFLKNTSDIDNIKFLRMTSGSACKELKAQSLGFVFIDAVHDFANTWFDFFSWSSLVVPGGLIAMHDVDDFPGTHLAFRRIAARTEEYRVWSYCPNLAIVQKITDK
jgi:predicted O-methyltransferase YrrM